VSLRSVDLLTDYRPRWRPFLITTVSPDNRAEKFSTCVPEVTGVLGRLCATVTTAFTVLTTALAGGAGATAPGPVPAPPVGQDWTADLSTGAGVGVVLRDGTLSPSGPLGLLTLPPTPLHTTVSEVAPTVDAQTVGGGTVRVDVRGRMPGGAWSEWRTGNTTKPAHLQQPTSEIQVRLLITAGPTPAEPSVRGLRLNARLQPNLRIAAPPGDPAAYQVIATREGLAGGRTANGHTIRSNDLFVALPSSQALAQANGSEYSVKVCSRAGYCAWAPVWDIGPWNTTDDYWSQNRQGFPELTAGIPQAQAAYRDGYNSGKDGGGRKVANPAGIDLSDGVYQSVLGLTGNSLVNVSYLWTGNIPLSTVNAGGANRDQASPPPAALASTPSDGTTSSAATTGSTIDNNGDPGDDSGSSGAGTSGTNANQSAADTTLKGRAVTVRTAPDPSADPAGVAADRAGVPVRCITTNGWARIDPDAYLPASSVTLATQVPYC
jgi:hypothetical protein